MKKILTIIFDGFGMKESDYGNAIINANMVNFNKFYIVQIRQPNYQNNVNI